MKKNLILIFLGISALVILLYFLFPKKEEKKNFYQNISIEDAVVKKLYDLANPSNNVTSILDVYKKEVFSNEFILGTSFVALLKENPNHNNVITEEELNVYINKIFGNVTYAHSTGFIVSPELCNFKYDKTNHNYTISKGCEEKNSMRLEKKLISAKKSDTEYILTEKVILLKSDYDLVKDTEQELASLKIYGDVFENKLINEIIYKWDTQKEPKIKIEDYLNEAATYEYYFTFDGNSFIYKNIQKVG